MANDILIVPGSSKIEFSGSQANTIQLETQTSGSVVFTGASGSLFGISDNFSGSLMSVADVSGIPILEVFDDDRVVMGSYSSPAATVTGSKIGIGTASPTHKLHAYSADNKGFFLEKNLGNNADNLNEFSSYYSLSIKNRNAGSFLNFGGDANRSDIQATDGAASATGKYLVLNPFGGNVGIGVTSPGYKLAAAGRGSFFATNQDAGWGMLTLNYGNGTNTNIKAIQMMEGGSVKAAYGFGSNGDIVIYANNSEKLRILANGNMNTTGNMVLQSDGVTVATLYDSGGAGHAKFHNFIRNADGAASTPSYTFDNDANTGMYRLTSDQIGFATNGGLRLAIENNATVLKTNGAYLYGVTSGAATVALIGVRTDNWMILGNANYGFVWQNGAGSIDGAGNAYWTKPNTFTGGDGTLNGNGSNLGGSYDLSIGSQSSGKGSRIILNAGHSTGEFVMQARQSSGYSNGNIGFYRRTGVTSYTTLMHIGGNGAIGIATESPTATARLTVSGLSNIPGIRSTTGYQMDVNSAHTWRDQSGNGWKSEKVFYVSFPNTASDRAVNLQFVHYFHGYLEITISGGYSNQNTVGMIKKRYYLGFNNNGNIWQGSQGHIVSSFGPIHNQIRMMNVSWDGSRYILPICHIVSTGNSYTISVKAQGAGYNDPEDLTLGSVYAYGSSPSAEYPQIKAGTSDVLSTDAGGNVGIGTTGVISNRRLRVWSDTDTYAQIETSNAGADTWVYFRNAGDNDTSTDFRMGRSNLGLFILGAGNGTTHMAVTSAGKVGIGTTNPGPRLEVRGAAQTSGTNLKHHITTVDNSTTWNGYPASGIAFAGNYNSTPSQIEFGGIMGKKWNATHGDLRGQLQFTTNTNSNVQTIAMTITPTQNVGIGSTNPAAKLDVAGAVKTSDKFQIGNLSVMELDGGNLSIQHDEESVSTIIRGMDGDGSLTVGEGETQINGNLKLTKTSNSWINLRAQDGSDTTGAGITWYETGTYNLQAPQYGAKIVYNEDTDDFKIGTMSNNTYITQIVLPRGSGILETRHVRPQANNVYDIGGSGIRYDDIFATNGTINTSDRNEKTQISGSDLGLTFVNNLNPVKYQFKSGSRTHYGLIAQEVSESLVSSSIHTDDFAGYIRSEVYTSGSVTLDKKGILASNEMDLANFTKSGEENLGLRYTEFVAPLIKAVQELTDEVKFLRASITGSTDLDQLKATISGSNFG